MIQNPLNLHDRVHVYWQKGDFKGVVREIYGVTVRVLPDASALRIRDFDHYFHYKQCRKLKPKKKIGLRRIWLYKKGIDNLPLNNAAPQMIFASYYKQVSDYIEFVEVMK